MLVYTMHPLIRSLDGKNAPPPAFYAQKLANYLAPVTSTKTPATDEIYLDTSFQKVLLDNRGPEASSLD